MTKRLNRILAYAGALLFFLAALALSAPLHGCTRTARAVGNLVESIGADMKAMVGPEEKPVQVAGKERGE